MRGTAAAGRGGVYPAIPEQVTIIKYHIVKAAAAHVIWPFLLIIFNNFDHLGS